MRIFFFVQRSFFFYYISFFFIIIFRKTFFFNPQPNENVMLNFGIWFRLFIVLRWLSVYGEFSRNWCFNYCCMRVCAVSMALCFSLSLSLALSRSLHLNRPRKWSVQDDVSSAFGMRRNFRRTSKANKHKMILETKNKLNPKGSEHQHQRKRIYKNPFGSEQY